MTAHGGRACRVPQRGFWCPWAASESAATGFGKPCPRPRLPCGSLPALADGSVCCRSAAGGRGHGRRAALPGRCAQPRGGPPGRQHQHGPRYLLSESQTFTYSAACNLVRLFLQNDVGDFKLPGGSLSSQVLVPNPDTCFTRFKLKTTFPAEFVIITGSIIEMFVLRCHGLHPNPRQNAELWPEAGRRVWLEQVSGGPGCQCCREGRQLCLGGRQR